MRASESRDWEIIIVGGGIAAYSAAAAIAGRDPACRVAILSEEDRVPYRRTKISKLLAQGFAPAQLEIQPSSWYRDNHLEIRANCRVAAVDPRSHTLSLEDGSVLSWKKLILAPGAAAGKPQLPGYREAREKYRAFCLRTALDAELLRAFAAGRESALVVGMGVLGVEVAEQLRNLGLQVTVAEAQARAMAADLDDGASVILEKILRDRGIRLLFSERVHSLEVDGNGPLKVGLTGRRLRPDLLVFCLGAVPRAELALGAGLPVQRGILADSYLRTSHPDIYAAGDAVQHPDGGTTHLWHAAEQQGAVAGANACGADIPYPNPPFRLKCEVFGHYFFSMNWKAHRSSEQHSDPRETAVYRDGTIYRHFQFKGGRVAGVVMIDDRSRAELYKQAVVERWTSRQVEQLLPTG
jgi:NAD(P)H-nitrite reductase large subunit